MDESDFAERIKNTGRNESCPCGSGKKYKKCHLLSDQAANSKEIKKQQAALEKANAENAENEESTDDKKADKSKYNAANSGKKFKMNKTNRNSNIPRRSAK